MAEYIGPVKPTRRDRINFGIFMFIGLAGFAVAVFDAFEGSWGHVAVFSAAAVIFLALAFAWVSPNPRVRRLVNWPRSL
jgi:hypothetical protein